MTPDPWSAVWLSILVGAASTVATLPVALATAWVLARKRFVGRSVLSALVLAPLVLPPVVTGLLLLRLLGRASPLGRWLEALGWPVPFSLTGATIAAVVVGFPLYVSAIRSAFEAVDPRLEEVSATLGATPGRTFFRVTFPLALPGVAAGMVLAFARGLGEFGATAVIAGNIEGRTRTIALAVYALLEAPDGESALTLLLFVSLGLSTMALVGFELLNRWQRRRLELHDG
ncbi:MAG: molybdate ABC transporter permease subunit [Myxococcales bacterium]|nr:molybdate ABC transporter permease subunit [Myxococcales bacterium]